MSKAKPLIGFDRYVEKAWMDRAAQVAAKGKSLPEANESLDEYLLPSISGETSRRKTKNILTATWLKAAVVEEAFKKEAVNLFVNANNSERLALHFGMSIATYPFFLSLGKILGRLFKLQDEITNTEFQRRVIESNGDTDSIKRAAARYLQSLIEWGVITSLKKGVVYPSPKIQLNNAELITWLYGSVLYSSDRDRLAIDDITSNPVWFPFEIPHGYFNVSNSKFIEIVHQGIGETLVALKK